MIWQLLPLLAVDANVSIGTAIGKAFNPIFQGTPIFAAIFLLLVIGLLLFKAATPLTALLPVGLVIAFTFFQGWGQDMWPLYVLALVATGFVFILAVLNITNR